MSTFREIIIQEQYDTSIEDVLNEFYKPVLEKAVSFDRAAGFFSPELLLESLSALRKFIKSNGHMRFIISPLLRNNDLAEIMDVLKNPGGALLLFEQQFSEAVNKDEELKPGILT